MLINVSFLDAFRSMEPHVSAPIPYHEAYLAFIQEERSKGIARDKATKDEMQTQGIFNVLAQMVLP